MKSDIIKSMVVAGIGAIVSGEPIVKIMLAVAVVIGVLGWAIERALNGYAMIIRARQGKK